jgi:uncharacterized membrane protein (UPF0182 family)
MAGRIDDEGNQSLVSYTVPGTAVDGPILANAAMLNSPDIAERTTLLGQTGSSVRLGNMILLPLDDDNGEERILYVRPLYVDAEGGLPLLRLVIVAYDDAVRMCPTLELALGALFVAESDLDEDCNGVVSPLSGEPTAVADPPGTIDTPEPTPDPAPAPTPTPQATPDAGPTPTPPPVVAPPADVQSLLGQAQTAFDSADEALAEGDLGRYQELIDEGQALLDQALALIATADEPAAAPEPSPVPTPTPSPEGA